MAAEVAGTADIERLIEEHLPLVEHIVLRISGGFPRFVDRSELVAAGTLGLVEAARRYDPAVGVPFARYATRRVRGAVLDVLRQSDWAPRSVRALHRRVEAAEQELATRNGRRPDDGELASRAGLSVEGLVDLRRRVQQGVVMALDQSFDDGDGGSGADRLHDRSSSTPDEDIESAELRGYVRDAVRHLPERHRIVAVGLYLEGKSFEELADLLGVCPSRISQLRTEAVHMVRDGVEAQFAAQAAEPATGRVARRKAAYAAEIARASSWRDRLMASDERILTAPSPRTMQSRIA
jgi:RNA polymerase sigma factor for flagellar operon FliA